MITVNKFSPIYRKAFYDVFKSMQLSGHYVLFYDMDFEKEWIVKFQSQCAEVNEEIQKKELHEADMEKFLKEEIGFDCKEYNKNFPYRTKVKMCEVQYKQKDSPSISAACNDACHLYFVLAAYTLVKKKDFTIDQLDTWYDKLIEFCYLYVTGMKDKHVFKYFEQEVDLKITE